MKRTAIFVLLVVVAALLGLLYTSTNHYASMQEQRYQPDLPMTFDHATHGKEKCVDCHHNFIDGSGQGLCIACHLENDEVKLALESQFHSLCMGCHEERQLKEEIHGPVRACEGCHTMDHLP